MSDTGLCLARHFAGAGVALALFLGMSAAAEARGIVADEGTLLPLTGCSLTSCPLPATPIASCTSISCSSPISFDGLTVYAYSDGAISIGSPLPGGIVPNNPATFGTNYFAAGLFDYSQPGFSIHTNVVSSDISLPKLAIMWSFTDTATGSPLGTSEGVFGIELTDNQDGTFTVASGVGVSTASGTWGSSFASTAYCDELCQLGFGNSIGTLQGDNEAGVYLPDGAEVGFSYDGKVFDLPITNTPNSQIPSDDPPVFSYPEYSVTFTPQTDTTVSVPEPADWSIILFGLGALGLLIRQSKRRGLLKTRV